MNTIRVEIDKGIAVITLNRPEVHNAINLQMVDELTTVLEEYRESPEIKVIVFTGAGSSFISGGDLDQFIAVQGKEQSLPLLMRVGQLLSLIDNYPKPTIAMINGTAVGGGCEFAISCHFRYASDTAKIGFVQIGMHITTGWGGGTRLLHKLPEAQALTLLLTGERVNAERAKELGFLDYHCPDEILREKTMEFAGKLAAQPLHVIEAYIRMLAWKRSGLNYEERIRMEIEQCADKWGSEQHLSVVKRFLNKL